MRQLNDSDLRTWLPSGKVIRILFLAVDDDGNDNHYSTYRLCYTLLHSGQGFVSGIARRPGVQSVMWFVCLSADMLRQYLKLGHDRFLPHPFIALLSNDPILLRCSVYWNRFKQAGNGLNRLWISSISIRINLWLNKQRLVKIVFE